MTNKFTLSHEDGEVTNTMSFTTVHLDQLLENLDRFIKASGFVPKGELEYVEEDTEKDPVFLLLDTKYGDVTVGVYTDEETVIDAMRFMNTETEKGRFDYCIINTLNHSQYRR